MVGNVLIIKHRNRLPSRGNCGELAQTKQLFIEKLYEEFDMSPPQSKVWRDESQLEERGRPVRI